MGRFRADGFVGGDTLHLDLRPLFAEQKRLIACLGGIVIRVQKAMSEANGRTLEPGTDPWLVTDDYSYNAHVAGEGCTFLRYDNAHAHDGHADEHHRHHGDWRTGGRRLLVGDVPSLPVLRFLPQTRRALAVSMPGQGTGGLAFVRGLRGPLLWGRFSQTLTFREVEGTRRIRSALWQFNIDSAPAGQGWRELVICTCGRKANELHRHPDGGWMCRRCANLGYPSQYPGRRKRARRRRRQAPSVRVVCCRGGAQLLPALEELLEQHSKTSEAQRQERIKRRIEKRQAKEEARRAAENEADQARWLESWRTSTALGGP